MGEKKKYWARSVGYPILKIDIFSEIGKHTVRALGRKSIGFLGDVRP